MISASTEKISANLPKIFAYNLFSKKGQVIRLDSGQKLIDAVGGKDFLYILWENEVHLHTLKSKE